MSNVYFISAVLLIAYWFFQIIVWGHSLGSAICAHTVAEFDLETGGSSTVSGVILESPFNTMAQEILSFG